MGPGGNDIIGRDAELAALSSIFDEARAGRGGVVLVSGEAGVGISRLAGDAIARSGFQVLVGRAREDAAPSYAPLAAALRGCLRGGTQPEDCGPLAEHLALILPELGAAPGKTDPGTLVEAIAGALSTQSRRFPTTLFLDDLQWADNATLELIPYLDERLRDERLLVVATVQSDEIGRGHPVRRMRGALRRARRLREVAVEPLGTGDTARLVERVIGAVPSPGLVRTIHARTRGFPFYVEELARVLVSAGQLVGGDDGMALASGGRVPVPESVRDAVLLTLDGLSDDARSLLHTAAVGGAEFDLALVCGIAGSDAGLDELTDAGLVREIEPGRGAFRHALVREAVAAEVGWSRRRALHRALAGALEKSGASPEAVAGHWLEAGEHAAARVALLRSAERSCRLHAYRDATAALSRALEVWPEDEDEDERVGALERLAHCAQVSGQLADAVHALDEMLSTAAIAVDDVRRAEVLRAKATVCQMQGAWEGAVESRRAAAQAFETAAVPGEAAVEWLVLAGRYTAALLLDAALDTVRTAATLADGAARWDVKARALGLEGNLLAMAGDYDAGRERVREGLSLALAHNFTEAAAEVYRRLGSVHEYRSDYGEARDAYFTAVDYCRTQGMDAAEHTCLGCLSYIVLRTGEWKRALEVCRELVERDDTAATIAIADGVAGIIRAHRGEMRQAKRLLKSSLETARRYELAAVEMSDLYSLAVVAEYEGEDNDAAAYYRRMIERWRRTNERHDIIPWLCWAATFSGERGDESEVAACAEILALVASESANAEALAGLAYVLGEAALVQGKAGDAATHFEQSLAHVEKLELPLEQALTQYRLGVALRRAGRGRDAAARMTGAYRIARKLGARPLAARIAASLAEMGERVEEGRHPEPSARERRGGLTRRQVEIAGLISEGLTNKEIAHRLYLSPRTVDMHVSNLLDRLDCRSRTEAAQKARDLGIIE